MAGCIDGRLVRGARCGGCVLAPSRTVVVGQACASPCYPADSCFGACRRFPWRYRLLARREAYSRLAHCQLLLIFQFSPARFVPLPALYTMSHCSHDLSGYLFVCENRLDLRLFWSYPFLSDELTICPVLPRLLEGLERSPLYA